MTTPQPGRRPIPARSWRSVRAAAQALARAGITPNQISMFGLLAGVGSGIALWGTSAVPALARPLWIAAAACIVLRALSNMFDGMVAVEHGKATPTGLFYNELPDRISDLVLMAGAGYAIGGSTTAGWAAAALALLTAYVRALGVIAGAPADFRGPMAKQPRMFLLAAASVYLALTPDGWHPVWGPQGGSGLIAMVLWLIVAGCVVTIVRRLARAVRFVTHPRSSG